MNLLHVVIPVHDPQGPERLALCLRHLRVALDEDHSSDVVVTIVSDDREAWESWPWDEIVDMLTSDDEKHEYTVDLVSTGDKPIGYAEACNIGANEESDFLLFLNSDVYLAPDHIVQLIDAMYHRNAVAVGGCMYYPEQHPEHPGLVQCDGVGLELEITQKSVTLQGFSIGRADPKYKVVPTTKQRMPNGAALLVDTKAFHKVGKFASAYFNGNDDMDLFMRLATAFPDRPMLTVSSAEAVHDEFSSGAIRWHATTSNVHEFTQRWLDKVVPHRIRYMDTLFARKPGDES